MKFSKMSQLFLVSSIGLVLATLLTACQLVTVDYVFVASTAPPDSAPTSTNGSVQAFAVDSQSGALRKAGKSISSGGVGPLAMAISPGYNNVYVANSDGTVVHFALAVSGALSVKDTITLSAPATSLAVSPDGKALYAVWGTTSAALTEYALSSGAIGSATATEQLTVPGSSEDQMVPTGVTVLGNGTAVYATAYDLSAYNPGGTTSSSANPGWVFGFVIGSGGALAPSSGSPYTAGVKPTALAADPTSRFIYVTDFASNQLIGYGVQTANVLSFMVNGPFRTGNEPDAISIDPRGRFIYVANALDSTVSAYVIDLPTGTPSSAINPTGSSSNTTDPYPVAIAVDPALGRFVYTANFLGNSVSGFQLDPTAGTLKQTQATPYPSDTKPTAIVVVPHGNHSLQTVAP